MYGDMKMQKKNIARGVVAATFGVAAVLGLSACEEKEATAEVKTPTTVEGKSEGTEAQAESAPAQDAKEALFESLVYELGVCASENADHPELNVAVRNMLALMEEYYTQNAEAMAGTLEKVRLSQRMADTIRHLKAWERATGSYDRALADYDALPEAERNKTDVKRMLSALCNGKAFCLVNLQKPAEALELYNKALEIDSALYEMVAPPEGEALPEGDVEPNLARAAEDIFFSYRCLGECQEAAGEPEEARDTIKQGIELAKRLDRLSPGMSLQYIRLLGALGNLESRCGKDREALGNWVQAAQMCQRLHNSVSNLTIRSKTLRQFQSLVPQIQELEKKLNPQKAEEQAQQPAEQPQQPAAQPQPAAEQPAQP